MRVVTWTTLLGIAWSVPSLAAAQAEIEALELRVIDWLECDRVDPQAASIGGCPAAAVRAVCDRRRADAGAAIALTGQAAHACVPRALWLQRICRDRPGAGDPQPFSAEREAACAETPGAAAAAQELFAQSRSAEPPVDGIERRLDVMLAGARATSPAELSLAERLECHAAGLFELGFDECRPTEIARFCDSQTNQSADTTNERFAMSCAPTAIRLFHVCQGPPPESTGLAEARWRVCSHLRDPSALTLPQLQQYATDRRTLLESASAVEGLSGGRQLVAGGGGIGANFAVGATMFFVDRAEQELLLFLRDRIGGSLCPDQTAGSAEARLVRTLLTNTCAVLRPADGSSSTDALSALPAAFRRDLQALPVSLAAYLFPVDSEPAHAELKTLGCVYHLLAPTLRSLMTGEPITTALRAFQSVSLPAWCTSDPGWAAVQQRAQLSAALVATLEETLRLRRELRVSDIGTAISTVESLPEFQGPTFAEARAWLRLARERFERLARAIARVEGIAAGEAGDRVRELVGASFSVLALVLTPLGQGGVVQALETHAEDVLALVDAFSAVAQQDFSAGILALLGSPMFDRLLDDTRLSDFTRQHLRRVIRYASLMAEVADAQTSEDVTRALESAASPVGSWREYRRRQPVIYIAGILGATAGGELRFGSTVESGSMFGVYLPIGLEIGGVIHFGSDWVLNIMVSVLDVGALANVRLDGAGDDEANAGTATIAPDFDFASVLAPGLVFSIGAGDTPFVFGLGAAFAPAHRPFFVCPEDGCPADGMATTTSVEPTLRLHAFVGMDLPVLPIF